MPKVSVTRSLSRVATGVCCRRFVGCVLGANNGCPLLPQPASAADSGCVSSSSSSSSNSCAPMATHTQTHREICAHRRSGRRNGRQTAAAAAAAAASLQIKDIIDNVNGLWLLQLSLSVAVSVSVSSRQLLSFSFL